jgi:hypothetical protein
MPVVEAPAVQPPVETPAQIQVETDPTESITTIPIQVPETVPQVEIAHSRPTQPKRTNYLLGVPMRFDLDPQETSLANKKSAINAIVLTKPKSQNALPWQKIVEIGALTLAGGGAILAVRGFRRRKTASHRRRFRLAAAFS